MKFLERLARIPPPWWGWFLLLGLVCGILLAIGSGFAWLAAGRAERRADARAKEYIVLRDSLAELFAGRWVRLSPWDRVYYGRPPRDTLRRAAP